MVQNVISLSKQLEYFKHYKLHLSQLVGAKNAEEIIKNAVFVLSFGTNDFLQNYFVEPTRSQQYSVEKYQDFLVSCMSRAIKVCPGPKIGSMTKIFNSIIFSSK
jgi:hypothetical protein